MTPDEFWKAYRDGRRDFSGADLCGLDLRGERGLIEVDFSDADLRGMRADRGFEFLGVRFDGACMRDADLPEAVMRDCRFVKAEMPDVRMPGSVVDKGDFTRAWLLGADMRDIDVSGSSFVETDMGPSDRARTRADNARYENSDFEGSIVSEMSFAGVVLRGCSGEPARSDGADFTDFRALPRRPELEPGPEPGAAREPGQLP